jgi:hypothetical protein
LNPIWLALKVFWRILTDPATARRAEGLLQSEPTGPDLRLLAVLQRDGRLVDFLQEDIDPYGDAEVGAAVRDIHRGCRKALHDYLSIEPVMPGVEETAVTVPADFDASSIRLSGHVSGTPPFQGVLKHHGWKVTSVQLPALPGSQGYSAVLSPAEVEIAAPARS